MKKVINSPKAPKAIGPYSQAIEVNGMIYISGQLPVDVNTGKFAEGGIQEQTEQSLKNIGYILEANFKAMNEVYAKYFTQDCPARAAFAVKDLPMGALVEIEVVAAK